ncbi:MAG: ABC transporter substrate-binding protein [Bacteroidota bacterium]
MKKTHANLFITLSLSMLLFFSCNPKDVMQRDHLVFRYNESKGIPTLDPAYARNQTIIWPTHQLFNSLVALDSQLKVVPSIAKSWKVDKSGKNYTFHLRTDVYFHDDACFEDSIGRRVNAKDIKYSLQRLINPKVASPGAWILNPVKELTPINDSTLAITLHYPFPAFLGLLSMQYASVVPHEAIDYYGDEFRAHPVGTGPFRFKYWKEGEKLILRRNKNYFEKDSLGQSLPYLEAIAISFITDKQAEFMEFLKGNLDFISGLNPANKDELITREGQLTPKYKGKVRMQTAPYLNTEYLAFMTDTNLLPYHPIAHDKRIRQAVNYGFDRKKMMRYLRNNMGTPANHGFVPLGLPTHHEEAAGYTYQPEKARQLLSEAGFPGGKNLPPITLTTTSDYLDLCEFIQHQLSQIGIPIEIEVNTGATYRDRMAHGKLPFFRGSWIADYADAENYLALFYSENKSPKGPNYTQFSNTTYDQLYRQSMRETDDDKRLTLYRQMNDIITHEAIVVPLYYDRLVRFLQPGVEGLPTNPLNLLTLKKARKHDDTNR